VKLIPYGRPRRAKISTRHFAYFNTRVYAMRGRLLPRDTYNKFLQMDIPEIARFLGETEYKSEIEQLGKRYRGVDLVEYALNLNLADTFHGLLEKAQTELKVLIKLYMGYYDLENITTILRGKLSNITDEEVQEALIPAGSLETAKLNQLIEADYDETLDMLRKMGYHDAVEMLVERPLPEVEDMMRRRYYEDLLEATEGGNKSMQMFNYFMRTEIDFVNLINFLRLKRDNEAPDIIMKYMVEGGIYLRMDKLFKLAEMSFDEMIKEIELLSYFRESPGALVDASESLVGLEAVLLKKQLDYAAREARQNPLSVLVVLSYILAKRVEVDNIRKIVRGKEGELPIELIRRQLVA
jgi:V/A-type H+-transporting ATPase subunit C